MSYILDAIKKAETQRQFEQVPTLGCAVAFQPNSKSRMARKISVFLLLIAVIAVPLYLFREPVQIKASEGISLAQSWLSSMMASEDSTEDSTAESNTEELASEGLSEQELAAQSMGKSLKELELGSELKTTSESELQNQPESATESEKVSKAIVSPQSIAP